MHRLLLPLILCLSACFVHAAAPITVFKVRNVHEGSPFECTISPQATAIDGCLPFHVRFPSPVRSALPSNNSVTGELFRPIAPLKTPDHPAVLVFHIIGPGTFQLERLICRELARRGVTAMFIHLPFYGLRGDKRGPYAMLESADVFSAALAQSVQDARRALDVLQSLPEVNPSCIGVTGVSLGSLMSAVTAGADPRVSKCLMVLGGGNLPQIIANRTFETEAIRAFLGKLPETRKQAFLDALASYDPLTFSERLKQLSQHGGFKMLCADHDNVIPRATSEELSRAVGCPIHWLPDSDHYTAFVHTQEILTELTSFFSGDSPRSWKAPAPTLPLKAQLLKQFASELLDFTRPSALSKGRCHSLKGRLTLFPLQGISLFFNVHAVLGQDNAFRLELALPQSNQVVFSTGQNADYLWCHAGQNLHQVATSMLNGVSVFDNPLVDKRDIQLFQAALAFASAAPDLLDDIVTIQAQKAADGVCTLQLQERLSDPPRSIFVTFSPDQSIKSIHFSNNRFSIALTLHEYGQNIPAAPHAFDPPEAQSVLSLDPKTAFQFIFSHLSLLPISRTRQHP